MEYLDMLDELIHAGYLVNIKSVEHTWVLTINDIVYVDQSLESLIGIAYESHYMRSHK